MPIETRSRPSKASHTVASPTPSPVQADEPVPQRDRSSRHGPGRIDLDHLPLPLDGSIMVRPWPDHYLAEHGHDVRSSYVELFWLGILGPSSMVLLRRLAAGLEHAPQGYRLPVVDTARSLGLAPPTTRNSAFVRALYRCVIFRIVRFVDADLEIRRRLPTLHPAQLERLPVSLQAAHATLVATRGATPSGRAPSGGSRAGRAKAASGGAARQ